MKKHRPAGNFMRYSSNGESRFGTAISRRGFLIAGAGLATIAALPIPALARGYRYPGGTVRRSQGGLLETELRALRTENLIPQWEVVTSTYKGKLYFAKKLVDAFAVDTRTYEGTIPGPVLRVRRGDVLRIKQSNEIPPDSVPTGLPMEDINIPHGFNITNIHTHGFNVPPTCEFDDDGNIIKCSDNVLVEILPGESLDYEYEIPDNHPDGTFWYHPHKHGSVAFQMMGGMGGAIVIKGPTDRFLRRIGVRKDKVFAIQQVRVKEEDGTVQVGNFGDFIAPPRYTVNGELNPVIYIRPGEVQRWRFVNAGMSEHVPLQLLTEDGDPQPLYQIAADGITLPNPVESELVFWGRVGKDPEPGIFMASGNRADVLIKCDEPGVYQLIKPEFDQGFLEGPIPQVPNPPDIPEPLPGQELPIATVICTGRPRRHTRTDEKRLLRLRLPTPLEDIPDQDFEGRRRLLTFAVDPSSFFEPFPRFQIGGRYDVDQDGNVVPSAPTLPEDLAELFAYLQEPHMTPLQFDPGRVDQVIKEGAVEEWTIVNLSNIDHPFHIHQVAFQVVAINDPRISEDERAIIDSTLPRWQDVQNIPGGTIDPETFQLIEPGSITIRIRFEGGDFTGRRNRASFEGGGIRREKQSIAGDFVLHCHILDHEDTGMMQLVRVVPMD